MTSGQRGGLAVAFVAVIAVVLVRPVITGDDEPTSREPSGAATTEETPTESPTPTPTETDAPEGPPSELTAAFPRRCLTPEALAAEPGLVAAISTRGTFIATPSGDVEARIEGADGPIGWSPSGRYLLTGAGLLFGADGASMGPLFGDAVNAWAWSPQSDCAFAIDATGQLIVVPASGGTPTVLLESPVQNFAVSTDRIAVSSEPGLFSIYNLRSGRLVGESTPIKGGPVATLVGWRGTSLVYASGSERALDLRAIEASADGTRDTKLGVKVGPALAVPCGDRLIGVTPSEGLVDVDSGEALGDDAFRYGRPACPPDGSYIAVPRRPRNDAASTFQLVLLDPDGTFVQEAGPGGPGDEGTPEWSQSASQLIFLKATGADVAEVWYAASGGGGPSGIKAAVAAGSIDWNVSAPRGIPAQ